VTDWIEWLEQVTGPYKAAIERVADGFEHPVDSADNVDGTERFLLIERSIYDRQLYLATYNSPEDATGAHDSQEYPEDWPILRLVDLETGEDVDIETAVVAPGVQDRSAITILRFTAADADALVGHEMSERELALVAKAMEHSGIDDTFTDAVHMAELDEGDDT
jgi:hypothetical protein